MPAETSNNIALLSEASRALEQANSLDEVTSIRDKAEAVRIYAQSAKLGLDLQNYAAEIKLRAERKAGKLIAELRLRGGDRKSNSRDETLKLDDLGIDRNQSSRWQQEASVPDQVFHEYLTMAQELKVELTAAGLIRLSQKLRSNGNSKGTKKAAHASQCSSQPGSENWDQPCDEDLSDLTYMITELINHHQLLASILGDVCGACDDGLRSGERKALSHLLTEMKIILISLSRVFSCEMHAGSPCAQCPEKRKWFNPLKGNLNDGAN